MKWLGSSLTCSRQVYWISVSVLCVCSALAKAVHLDPLMVTGLWIMLYRMRLRDCGRTQWWALGVIMLEIVPFLVAGVFGGQPFAYAITHQGVDESGRQSWLFGAAVAGAVLIQFAFTAWLGSLKGREESREHSATADGQPSIWEARSWEDDEAPSPSAPPMVSAPPPPPISYGDRPQPANLSSSRPVFGRRAGA
jgi:uncharacterized membrane protein YhaH (DUF805 family)